MHQSYACTYFSDRRKVKRKNFNWKERKTGSSNKLSTKISQYLFYQICHYHFHQSSQFKITFFNNCILTLSFKLRPTHMCFTLGAKHACVFIHLIRQACKSFKTFSSYQQYFLHYRSVKLSHPFLRNIKEHDMTYHTRKKTSDLSNDSTWHLPHRQKTSQIKTKFLSCALLLM